jgi:hypothetical protein
LHIHHSDSSMVRCDVVVNASSLQASSLEVIPRFQTI